MNYLVDTNVISELRRDRPHWAVLAWISDLTPEQLLLSAMTIGELQKGIERLRLSDPERAAAIERWLEDVVATWRILPMDVACFRLWGRLVRGRPHAEFEDAMIAATALVHDLVVVTRNTKDFVDFGVRFLDPFVPR